MTANPLKAHTGPSKSPTDPHECCEWANTRLKPSHAERVRWVVTGDKAQPIRLAAWGE